MKKKLLFPILLVSLFVGGDVKALSPCILDSTYTWQLDSMTQSYLVLTDKHYFLHDANGNLMTDNSQWWNWNSSSFQTGGQVSYTYDANNNRLSQLTQQWNGSAWVNEYQYLYTYDANNNQLSESWLQWNGASWDNMYQYLYTYDANNNRISFLHQTWNVSSWLNFEQYLYTYNVNNKLVNELGKFWGSSIWNNWYQKTFTYDANNNQLTEFEQSWSSGNWVNYFQFNCTYDVNNNLINYYDQQWNTTSSAWDSWRQYFYTYTSNHLTNEIIQIWNVSSWDNQYQIFYTYDANYNITNQIEQYWNGSSWVNLAQYIFTYNSYNDQTSFVDQSWNGSSWYTADSTRNYYDCSTGIAYLNRVREEINIYPSPATNQLTIENGQLKINSIEIYDVLGRVATPFDYAQGDGQSERSRRLLIDVSALSPGIYFVKLRGDKQERVAKFVKQ